MVQCDIRSYPNRIQAMYSATKIKIAIIMKDPL